MDKDPKTLTNLELDKEINFLIEEFETDPQDRRNKQKLERLQVERSSRMVRYDL